VGFTFNEGQGNLASSTLLRELNAGNTAGAASHFLVWVYAGGVKLPGLVKRRRQKLRSSKPRAQRRRMLSRMGVTAVH
jgi:GH24 family phage-related lysozyme (muramidase)